MIEAINLCKSFDDKILFNDLSFQIKSGEFVCFSGESGKGKTTLLNMIGQIEPITSGTIIYDGKKIISNKDKLDFFRRKVGFVFQNFALVEGKTVEQNLLLVRRNDRENITIDEALVKVGLKDKKKRKVYTLSGGEQQRIALARLFIKKCNLILADEPTGSLDFRNASIIMDILKDLNKSGKTVILVTHDMSAKKQCDRVIEL